MTVISNEKVESLLAARATQIDSDIELLFDRLSGGTFVGISNDLADEIGIPIGRLWSALNRVRSADFVEENGWTIPYVPKGYSPKVWTVADATDSEAAMEMGAELRTRETIEVLRRIHAQTELLASKADRRTKHGKYVHYVEASVAALVAGGELILAGETG